MAGRRRTWAAVVAAGLWLSAAGTAPLPGAEVPRSAEAAALLDEGLRHMGGRERLAGITRVRFDMMTMWQRTSFDDVPYPDGPSYEHHLDVRDYTLPAWRNTRELGFSAGARTLVNVVRDSVAVTDLGQGFRPLSVAYVDERRELFAYTPDRLMLWAREAADLAAAGDTAVAGVPHARVRATVNGIPMTLYLRASDGLPSFVAFRRGHPNDFGLVPWGDMAVEVWYSRWRTFPDGVSLPTQWDVRRAGAPYKRMTVLGAAFNPDFAADSFAVGPEERAAYLASPAVLPMHDLALDSARVLEGAWTETRTFGSAAGAILLGDRWLLLEAGQAPLSTERALEWLERTTGKPVAAAVVGSTRGLHGGITALMDRGVPVTVGPAVGRLAPAALDGYGRRGARLDVVEAGRWIALAGDSVRVEPLDLPDVRGALVVWWPARRWLYVADALTPLDLELALEHADGRGWAVERVGTARGLVQPRP
ncbi:MAG: hypothetical protein AMXMBFR53_12000 [Gemmatimonadota bacterium]